MVKNERFNNVESNKKAENVKNCEVLLQYWKSMQELLNPKSKI